MSEEKGPTIQPMPNGPLMVKNVETLTNASGPIEAKPIMALCRCGQSANKPFCDGTHAAVGFTGDKEEGRTEDRQDDYGGREITIHDNRGICAHAGMCTSGLKTVFKYGQEPWIDPDGANPDEVKAVIGNCPSGAIRYTQGGETGPEEATEVTIHVAKNGPYAVKGGAELIGVERGKGAAPGHFTLCRCGGSRNKPFCDGSHHGNKFADEAN